MHRARPDHPIGPPLLVPGSVVGALAATAAENVHLLRARLTDADAWQRDPDVLVAPAALHATDGDGRLHCYGVDPEEPGRVRRVAVRRTPPLDAVLGLLAASPRTLADLESAFAGSAGATALRGFLGHLVRLGVLQPCLPPRRRTGGWIPARDVRRPGVVAQPAGTGRAHDWFTDSYRTVDATVPAAAADRVRRALAVAARVDGLRTADLAAGAAGAPRPSALVDAVGVEPRPLGALLLDLLHTDTDADADADTDSGPAAVPIRRYEGWHPAHDPRSGYARLLARLGRLVGDGTPESVDIGHALLDSVGAPPADEILPAWPLDCLLRPLPGPTGPVALHENPTPPQLKEPPLAQAIPPHHRPPRPPGARH
ncbi:hypothetical protein ACFW15_35460, partial [Streptomyces sp. NPDC058953]